MKRATASPLPHLSHELKISQEKSCNRKALCYIDSMICDTPKIQQQLALGVVAEGLGASPDREPRSKPPEKIWLTPERKEYMRKWHQQHPGKNREYCRAEYRRNHSRYRAKRGTEEFKANLREYMRRYREAHPERYLLALRASNRKHAVKRRAYRQRPEVQMRRRSRESLRYRTDAEYILAKRIRSRLREVFKRQGITSDAGSIALVGCSWLELKAHIQTQFVNGMVWENRGSYVIDHIIPMSAFDLRDAEELQWVCNWRNLRPITRYENSVKFDHLPSPLPSWLPPHIAARIVKRYGQANIQVQNPHWTVRF